MRQVGGEWLRFQGEDKHRIKESRFCNAVFLVELAGSWHGVGN